MVQIYVDENGQKKKIRQPCVSNGSRPRSMNEEISQYITGNRVCVCVCACCPGAGVTECVTNDLLLMMVPEGISFSMNF